MLNAESSDGDYHLTGRFRLLPTWIIITCLKFPILATPLISRCDWRHTYKRVCLVYRDIKYCKVINKKCQTSNSRHQFAHCFTHSYFASSLCCSSFPSWYLSIVNRTLPLSMICRHSKRLNFRLQQTATIKSIERTLQYAKWSKFRIKFIWHTCCRWQKKHTESLTSFPEWPHSDQSHTDRGLLLTRATLQTFAVGQMSRQCVQSNRLRPA